MQMGAIRQQQQQRPLSQIDCLMQLKSGGSTPGHKMTSIKALVIHQSLRALWGKVFFLHPCTLEKRHRASSGEVFFPILMSRSNHWTFAHSK